MTDFRVRRESCRTRRSRRRESAGRSSPSPQPPPESHTAPRAVAPSQSRTPVHAHCCGAGASDATAMHASPSARPTHPMPSFVFPFTLTAATSTPSAAASTTRIACTMRADLRSFGDNRDVGVMHYPAERTDAVDRQAQHLDGIAPAVFRVGVGEHLANVTGTGSAEHGIGQRVGDRVTIGVADERDIGRDGARRRGSLDRRVRSGGSRSRCRHGTGTGTGNREPGSDANFQFPLPVPRSRRHQAATPAGVSRIV